MSESSTRFTKSNSGLSLSTRSTTLSPGAKDNMMLESSTRSISKSVRSVYSSTRSISTRSVALVQESKDQTLRDAVRERFLKDLFTDKTADKHPGWKVMVVDHQAMRVVSSAIGMYDLAEHNIAIVEALEKKRNPQRGNDVIYLLEACEESVDRLLNEFDNYLYGKKVFVYFLGPFPKPILDKIIQCRPLCKRLKGLGEINIDFLVKEEHAFHLDMPSVPINTLTPADELTIASKLMRVCVALHEYPILRFAKNSESSQRLAECFDKQMEDYLRSEPEWWYHSDGEHSDRGRASLLLLDRNYDCLTPIMHDFTYQPMIYDLLETDEEILPYLSENVDSDDNNSMEQQVLLSEKDALWVDLRSRHIGDVSKVLTQKCKEIIQSDAGRVARDSAEFKGMEFPQMSELIRQIPKYKELTAKLSQHMHHASKCLDVFENKELDKLSELEQTLATGKTEKNEIPTLEKMVEDVCDMLATLQDAHDRARLLMIFIITQGGIKSKHKARLWKAAKLPDELEQMVKNLGIMNLSLERTHKRRVLGKVVKRRIESPVKVVDKDCEYKSSRYAPPLKEILSLAANNKLSSEDYPFLIPPPETSKAATQSIRRLSPSQSQRGRRDIGRILVFLQGGLSYSELSIARQVMAEEGRDIVIGSTHLITPKQFMDDLSHVRSN